ncbi:MAG: enoyl-CoA hydratase/isomerase family protein [Pseudomonadales bacterium]
MNKPEQIQSTQQRADADARSVQRFVAAYNAAKLDERIVVSLEQKVLWLRINRAEQHNALALDMLATIEAVLQLAATELARDADPDWLRLVVLTGAGPHSFAAGGDLKELDSVRTVAATKAMSERGVAALNAVRDFPQPVVAGLNGAARGGGAELAMACDWRVAHGDAAIGFIQGRLNLSPAWGGGTDLLRKLGQGVAMRVLAEARVIAADEAVQLGLIELLLPVTAEEFSAGLSEYVSQLSQHPAQILRSHKSLALAQYENRPRAHSQAVESALLVETWTHEDHWQAATGALKK